MGIKPAILKYAPVVYKIYLFVSTRTYVRNNNFRRRYPSYYRNVYDLINHKLYHVSNTTRVCRPSIFWSDRFKRQKHEHFRKKISRLALIFGMELALCMTPIFRPVPHFLFAYGHVCLLFVFTNR
jgi:hypothetical protein